MFLAFPQSIDGLTPPERFTFPFNYSPHPLAIAAKEEITRYIDSQIQWGEELSKGKMFGVLVVRNVDGEIGYLAAFSGNIEGQNQHDRFVPPIYDMLKPDEFFIVGQAEITAINLLVAKMEREPQYLLIISEIDRLKREAEEVVAGFKADMKGSKESRSIERSSEIDPYREQELVRESQFQKAELRRLEQRYKAEMLLLRDEYDRYTESINELKAERKAKSALLQSRIFEEFKVFNYLGERVGMLSLFSDTTTKIPPAGAGECAAPKLLQYAFVNHLTPICMAEFWWGASPKAEVRRAGDYYPSCIGKCKPILTFMLKGLEVDSDPLVGSDDKVEVPIVYEDDWLLVMDKPAGMLSVPGKIAESSLYSYVKEVCMGGAEPYMVHRLDMATSGLIVVAKSKEVHAMLQRQFEDRVVKKCYTAILDGVVEDDKGVISLPLVSDYMNRPCQKVDFTSGKEAVTRYEVLSRGEWCTKVLLYPHTGRTHQLRVHCAHYKGLGAPIAGDVLYGVGRGDRLCLHATTIEFHHPISGDVISFSSKAEFVLPAKAR